MSPGPRLSLECRPQISTVGILVRRTPPSPKSLCEDCARQTIAAYINQEQAGWRPISRDMKIPFYIWRKLAEDVVIADDDVRLEPLRELRWVATFCQGGGLYHYRYRKYHYIRRHYTEAGHKRREYIQQAIIRLLGEVVPPGHRIIFKNQNHLDCRRENLLIVSKSDPRYLNIGPGRRHALYCAAQRAALSAQSA